MYTEILDEWVDTPEARNLIDSDPEFATWLEAEYVPIAGGWLY